MAVGTRAPGEIIEDALPIEGPSLDVGSWLFVGALLFWYASWWFAFFYLKAFNNNSAWKASSLHVQPPNRAYGTVVIALVILGAIAWFFGSQTIGVRGGLFRLLGPVAFILVAAGGLFQVFEQWHLGFGLTDGGYPSVFAGTMGAWAVMVIVAAVWMISIVVQARAGGDTVMRPAAAQSFGKILYALAVAGLINYILLYYAA
jgi:heme/copper-type cytochrome/quinol oxidase subunit 3